MIILANEACGVDMEPWFFESYPMVCREDAPSLCPYNFQCRGRSGPSELRFCCRSSQIDDRLVSRKTRNQ